MYSFYNAIRLTLLAWGDNINNMKSIKRYSLLFIFMTFVSNSFGQNITSDNPYFVSSVISKNASIDSDDDGSIQISEAEAFTGILHISGATDVSGIEYFKNITGLNIPYGALTTLDVSENTKLTYLNLNDNMVLSLDLSNNLLLDTLICSSNPLTNIDISDNTNITHLDCSYSPITEIDVTNNELLELLDFSGTKITTLDLSNNIALTSLHVHYSSLISLDVSNNTKLITLKCNNNELTNMDITSNPKIKYFYCENNYLINLDLRNGANVYMASNLTIENNYLMCVSVDNAAWADATWSSFKDAGTVFSNDCLVGIEENRMAQSKAVEAYDLIGRKVKLKSRVKGQIYMVRDDNGRTSKQFYR